MKKEYYPFITVIPVGPNCRLDFILDTIASIEYYATLGHKIVLADDSQKCTGNFIQQRNPHIDVIETLESMGKLGGLYITLSNTFSQVLKKYDFDFLLRIDTDALVIGEHFEMAAATMFKQFPAIGLAGQYPNDFNGNKWDISWPKSYITRIFSSRLFFKQTFAHLRLLFYYLIARAKGYKTGESVFGGACFYSIHCLQTLMKKNLLPEISLGKIGLEEDHLFSLLVKSVGLQLGSLAGDGLPMACAWKGLPEAPQLLYKQQKKIIHSTRFWKALNEADIRTWFQDKRTLSSIEYSLSLNNHL